MTRTTIAAVIVLTLSGVGGPTAVRVSSQGQ